jgi:hypothetical protein
MSTLPPTPRTQCGAVDVGLPRPTLPLSCRFNAAKNTGVSVMPISKHRVKKNAHKSKKTQTSREQRGSAITFYKHPFASVPREKLIHGLKEMGKSHQEDFPKQIESVQALLGSANPLATIASLATYGLFGGVKKNGDIDGGYKGEAFNQSHVELAQALCLFKASEYYPVSPPKPDTIQGLLDGLEKVANTYQIKRFAQFDEKKSQEEKSVLLIQEALRLHTQGVRNWGFLSNVIGIMKRLCAPIDKIFEGAIGIQATQLIDLFTHLISRNERFINERRDRMRPAFAAKTVQHAIQAYYDANPDLQDNATDMMGFAEQHKITPKQIKALILTHSDLTLASVYTLDPEIISSECGICRESIISGLNRLSMSFGDLKDTNPAHLFLSNPAWTKPVIKVGEEVYFCAMPQIFFSFIFYIISELLEGNEPAKKQYQKRKADFLEAEIKDQFSRTFPHCDIASGYKWREGPDEYENDLMVRVDSHLLLIEAKSHSVHWSALRGAPDRAKKHVKDMLLDPSIQSLRLATRINEVLKDISTKDEKLPSFPFSLDSVRTIVRLSVTLEDFATLQSTLHLARDAGWFPADHPIAPCILLADLEIVFDILQGTPQKIHYLKRRADLEDHFKYKGDELDLLGFYLCNGFNIGLAEFDDSQFILTGASKPIDRYYEAKEEGIITPRPQPKITKWWKDICEKIEARERPQWTDASIALLHVLYEDQVIIEGKLKILIENVHKNWQTPGHDCAILLTPHKHRNDAIAVFAYKERDSANRHDRISGVVANVFEYTPHVDRCLVIGMNIDRMDYPYSLIAVLFKGEDTEDADEEAPTGATA